MSAHDQWTDQLSDYLDDELSGAERATLEAHLAECADCARTLGSLRRIVAEASSLQPCPPENDLWQGIAVRTVQQRRISFTIPQLAAASLLLAALSGGAVVLLLGGSNGRSQTAQDQAAAAAPAPDDSQPAPRSVSAELGSDTGLAIAVNVADAQYDEAVAQLERALEEGRGRLDATTVSVVEQNLSIIDLAIAEARGALMSDPSNGFLSGHLVEARRRKLDLLRRAAALTQSN